MYEILLMKLLTVQLSRYGWKKWKYNLNNKNISNSDGRCNSNTVEQI